MNVFATAVDRLCRTLKATRLRNYRLDDRDLIRKACLRTGRVDFGGDLFREPLRVLLDACQKEANLNAIGTVSLYHETDRLLCDLLKLQADITRHPDVTGQPIHRPIFIMGLPRSGTTFLHRLLAQDPGNHVPRCWQMLHPTPVERFARPGRLRTARANWQLGALRALAPEYAKLNPVNALSPQECNEILAHLFLSKRYDTLFRIPSYRRWLETVGVQDEAYRFHKRFLQYLQYRAGRGQWILKAPEHTFSIDAIRRVYPDAGIIFSHRDPLKIIPSVARLTEVMRRPFSRAVYPREIGAQFIERWTKGAEIMMHVGGQRPSAPVFHVKHLDLVREPVETVKQLYGFFGMPFRKETEKRLQRFLKKHSDGDYGSNHYTLERYGIDGRKLSRRFDDYMAFFDVEPEIKMQ
jgi:hypothetical protein